METGNLFDWYSMDRLRRATGKALRRVRMEDKSRKVAFEAK